MRTIISTFLLLFAFSSLFGQDTGQNFVTSDIDNFWTAYDKIRSTNDSTLQYQYLNKLFIEKGSPGLKAIMEAREYTSKSYVDAINHYPLFWNSIRTNTLKAKGFAGEIELEVNKIKNIYLGLKPAKIYFTVGALMTNGTTLDGKVLIGSELALTDKNTNTSEFPKNISHLRRFFDTEPIKGVVFLNIHEYVHTQQKTTIGNTLLAQSVLEGAAEFVAVTATGKQSETPAIAYGKQHFDRVREVFSKQMFNLFTGFWLYSSAENEFKNRDLGYYVGYDICEKYYQNAKDKKQAIKEIIELDYNNNAELYKFADKSGYFALPLKKLKKQFDNSRPTVLGISQFKNQDKTVDPAITQLTIQFSAKMDKRFRNFKLGPLGETNVLLIKKFVGFSEDGKSVTFEIELKPNQHYQLIVDDKFRDESGVSLKPYLIDIVTANN
ncbi:DUF2268 domain-containing putative Zn-dependent protease [Pedobacter punctiformis]|uniref:DUF2268 domain-containing protein n=1 Tax=Pedobacter punctiformis TaxID=3004097 RepID=A0ABT4L8N2_9SPHI|nr:hypothetical protein [Pedobacter sp. HCMS5-2]MCZ4244287.1 hypothetical protein [Pedobacter sp. HCMS5-2]